jgi:hypothetical protein
MNDTELCEKLATALMKVKSMHDRGYLSYLGMRTTEQMVNEAIGAYQESRGIKPEVTPERRDGYGRRSTDGPAIEGHPIAVIRSIREEADIPYEHGSET